MAKKSINYFDEFINLIALSKQAADKLVELLNDYSYDKAKEYAEEIHGIEHAGDNALHNILYELNRSFITPIDREDIVRLVNELDNINDSIEDVANLLIVLSINKLRPEIILMTKLVQDACAALYDAVKVFNKFKNSQMLSEYTIKVNKVEEEGDYLHRSIIHELFLNETNAVEIIKWQQIFNMVEDVLDNCEDVADLLDGLAIKNS